jgi:hypothetical protein
MTNGSLFSVTRSLIVRLRCVGTVEDSEKDILKMLVGWMV